MSEAHAKVASTDTQELEKAATMMRPLTDQLTEQNNGQAWRPCEYTARRRHIFGRGVVLTSGTTMRRCARCPVIVLEQKGALEWHAS